MSAGAEIPNTNAVRNEGRAPYRTEFISYDIRKEADAGVAHGSKYFVPLKFEAVGTDGMLYEARTELPLLWLDRFLYVRDEGRTGRYLLRVNGYAAGLNTDSYGTNDYDVTPFLREGVNTFTIDLSGEMSGGDMEDFARDSARKAIGNLYIYSQPKIHIFDYTVAGYPDPEIGDAVLDLAIVLYNGYNMEETVTVGYDVYDPKGNLKEYSFADAAIPGRGVDTVRFRNKIFGTEKYLYSTANPALYKVVLSVKYQGRNTEYIHLKVGFGTTGFDGVNILRNGVPVKISAVEADFPRKTGALDRLRQLKKQGVNTICVARPQQQWFYDMSAEEGFYVIDRAAVACDPMGDDRGPGGTIANDPSYLSRFTDRQQAMYYRNRNRANVIGWSIGADSGNGYNMYKSYQWLKAADPVRPVVYPGARGEWNSDLELPVLRP